MAHHKRGRPKSSRAGCLMCKSHKRNGCYQPLAFEVRAKDRMDASEAELFEVNDDVEIEQPVPDQFPSVHEAPKVTLGDLFKK